MLRYVPIYSYFLTSSVVFAQDANQIQGENNTRSLELEDLRLQSRSSADKIEELSKKIDESILLYSNQLDYIFNVLAAIGALVGIFVLLEFIAMLHRNQAEKQRNQAENRVSKIQADSIEKTGTLIGSINGILTTVSQHDIRVSKMLERSEKTAEETERQLTRLREIEKRKFDDAQKEADSFFNFSRMEFAALSSQAVGHSERLKQLVEELRGDIMSAYGDEGARGYIYYICGVLYYYDDKPSLALEYLNLSASESPQGVSVGTEAALNDRKRQSFTHYFMSIIMKSWGTLEEALQQIDLCETLFPPQARDTELLNPTTKAEILSYFPERAQDCLELISQCESKAGAIGGQLLNKRQSALIDRLALVKGNVHSKMNRQEDAKENYLLLFKKRPQNYYAATSLALLEHDRGNTKLRDEFFAAALDRFRATAVLESKFELTTRATLLGLSTLAQCGAGSEQRARRYYSQLKDLVSRRQVGESMVPRFFSPTHKVLVSAEELVDEIRMVGTAIGKELD